MEVLDKPTLTDQIAEMKECFKALQSGDHSVRDYRKHFKVRVQSLINHFAGCASTKLLLPFFIIM